MGSHLFDHYPMLYVIGIVATGAVAVRAVAVDAATTVAIASFISITIAYQFFSVSFYVWLLDYLIVLKARHDELFHESIT